MTHKFNLVFLHCNPSSFKKQLKQTFLSLTVLCTYHVSKDFCWFMKLLMSITLYLDFNLFSKHSFGKLGIHIIMWYLWIYHWLRWIILTYERGLGYKKYSLSVPWFCSINISCVSDECHWLNISSCTLESLGKSLKNNHAPPPEIPFLLAYRSVLALAFMHTCIYIYACVCVFTHTQVIVIRSQPRG